MVRIVVSALLLTAAPALAQPAPDQPKPKLVCRSQAQTGSYLRTRTCHTKEDWQTIDQVNKSDADRFRKEVSRQFDQAGRTTVGGSPL